MSRKMRIDILTLFPEMIREAVGHSILKRAQEAGLADIRAVDIRDFTTDRHRTTDDTPCGGGGGMIMKPEPIANALDAVGGEENRRVILTEPRGKLFSQQIARDLAEETHLVFVCGRYEGVDEPVRKHLGTAAHS